MFLQIFFFPTEVSGEVFLDCVSNSCVALTTLKRIKPKYFSLNVEGVGFYLQFVFKHETIYNIKRCRENPLELLYTVKKKEGQNIFL